MTSALVKQEPRIAATSLTVSNAIDSWLAALAEEIALGDKQPSTRQSYEIGVRKFMQWVEHHGTLSDQLVRAWVKDLRTAYAGATVALWLAGVRHFCGYCVGMGYMPFDPTTGIKAASRKGGRKHKRDALTDVEVLRVLEVARSRAGTEHGKRNYAIVLLMAYTGIRTVEAHRANVTDLRTRDGRLVLEVQGKGRQETDDYVVITNAELEKALYEYLAERAHAADAKKNALFVSFSPRSTGLRLSLVEIRHMIKSLYRAAGIVDSRKTTHSLRHSAAGNALRHGADPKQVQGMLRHQDPATTDIYLQGVERLDTPAEALIRYEANPS